MNVVSQLFCTYDRASLVYSPPFAAPHSGVAIRGFTDAINDPSKGTDLSRHPDDFDLFHVGDYDSSSGLVIPLSDGPLLVIQGKQLALQASLQV